MHVTLPRAALLPAIAAVQRLVERRNTIPILGHVLLSAAGGRLSLRGTDLDLQATVDIPATITRPGEATVPAATLHDIVKRLPEGGDVALEALADTTQVTVRAGRARFTLPALLPQDMPALDPGALPHRFDMPAADLAALLRHTRFAISSEETRYYLNGIYLHTAAASIGVALRAVATDGHRLSRTDVARPEGADGMPGVIVPRKMVDELARLAEAAEKAGETIALEVSGRMLRATVGGVSVLSKLIDGTFPDYQRVIPTANELTAEMDAGALAAAVDRVSTVASDKGRAIKLEWTDAADRLRIFATNPDGGSAADEVDAAIDGVGSARGFAIGFNGRYLLDAIAALDAPTLRLAFHDAGSPALATVPGRDDLLVVLMPMRV